MSSPDFLRVWPRNRGILGGHVPPFSQAVLPKKPIGTKRDGAGLSLNVSANGHYLVGPDGNPVFFAGDTAWRIVAGLDRGEMTAYLDKRRDQGFNVVLFVAFLWSDDTNGNRNAYSDEPFHIANGRYDPARPKVTPGRNPENATEYTSLQMSNHPKAYHRANRYEFHWSAPKGHRTRLW